MKTNFRPPHLSKGQTLVEFALILPLMLFIIFGLIEFGRLLAIYTMMTSSSRDAARYGAAAGDVGNFLPHYLDCAGIRTAARRNAILVAIPDENITISYDHGPGTAVFAAECPTAEDIHLGDRIIVRTVGTFEPIVPVLGVSSFPIESVSMRTIMMGVEVKGTPPAAVTPSVSFQTGTLQVSELDSGNNIVLNATLVLTAISDQNVTVQLSSGGSATSGSDYTLSSNQVTIPAGHTSAAIQVTVIGDLISEPTETIDLMIGAVTNANKGAPDLLTISILDNDALPTVYFSTATQNDTENHHLFVYVVLSAPSGYTTSVPYFLSGTATEGAGQDYTITPNPVVILPGNQVGIIEISVNDDILFEDTETIILTITTPTWANKGTPDIHTASILNNDPLPVVSFVPEAQSGPENIGQMTFTAQLNAPSWQSVTVPFTVGGTATYPGDYTITASPLVITAGSTQASATITVIPDALVEPDETIVVTMGTPTNATKGTVNTHTATILGLTEPPVVSFTAASQSVAENGGSTIITAHLNHLWYQPVSVDFTLSGTALRGYQGDYVISGNSIVFPVGTLSVDIPVTLVNDSTDEDDKTVIVSLTTPPNATLGSPNVHTITILDDDPTPSVQFAYPSREYTESTSLVQVIVLMSAPSAKVVSVPFTIDPNSTATLGGGLNPGDYSIVGSPVTIRPGATSTYITVTLVNDTVYGEPNETIILSLGNPTNAGLGAPETRTHTATIIENDFCPTVGTLSDPGGNVNKLDVVISNSDSIAVQITAIKANWLDNPASQTLVDVFLDSVQIWSDDDNAPPSDLPPTGGSWPGLPTTREIASFSSRTLSFVFSRDLRTGTSDYVQIWFSNGCSVIASRP